MAGYTLSFGAINYDMYIVKLDASSTLQWSRTAGGTGYDIANSIIQTIDGGYAVAGSTASFGAGGSDMYVVKLNSSGAIQWSRTVGGTGDDIAHTIIQTTDGGYIVAGSTFSFGSGARDVCVVKLDNGGALQWSKAIGGVNHDVGWSLIQTIDGGYAVGGYTYTFGAGAVDFYILKVDSNGLLQWNRTVGGTDTEFGLTIIQTIDSGYAIAGYTYSFGAGNSDMYIVKLNSSGTLQWSKTLGGTSVDRAYSMTQTTDGGYAIAGNTYSYGAGHDDIYVVKIDASGTLQWSRTVGGIIGDAAFSIIQTTDDGFVAAGYTESFGAGDMYIVKLDASGNTCGNTTSPQVNREPAARQLSQTRQLFPQTL